MTRRTLLNWTAAGAIARAFGQAQESSSKTVTPLDTLPGTEKNRKLKIVFVGAHVDDWCDCAGTLARYAREGHEVSCLSFTPGDSQSMADANHMSVEKLAQIRREDAIRGVKLIGAQFKILDQHNQNMHVDPEAYDEFNRSLAVENPDVVFGMWPLDFHPDHRAAANLAYNAWLASGMRFMFYLSETPEAGEMTTQLFMPNRWVDIESVIAVKHASVVANTFIKDWWAENEMWSKFRGGEYGCQYAEAFVHISTVASVAPKNIAPRRWSGGGVQIGRDRT